jgi:hypothetical protein
LFDGTVPVNLDRLKEIYRAIDQLSLKIVAFSADARREGLPKSVEERLDSLERETDKIRELFQGVLTDDEQDELMLPKRKRRKRRPRPWEGG